MAIVGSGGHFVWVPREDGPLRADPRASKSAQAPAEPVAELARYLERMQLGESGLFQGVSKRLSALDGDISAAANAVRERAGARVRAELAFCATCDKRGLAAWPQMGELAARFGLSPDPDAYRPSWLPTYGTWFDRHYQRALVEAKAGHFSEARAYLAHYQRLDPSVRHHVPDFASLRTEMAAQQRKNLLASRSLQTLLQTLDSQRDPQLLDDADFRKSAQTRIVELAAQALGRGLVIDPNRLARYGVPLDAVKAARAPRLADGAIEKRLAGAFRGDALPSVRWFLHDHPAELETIVALGIATKGMSAAEQMWMVNRARPQGDAHWEPAPFPRTRLGLPSVLQLFERAAVAPLVHEAAVAALNQPRMLAQLGAYLATATSRQVVALADNLYEDAYDSEDNAGLLVSTAISERRADLFEKLDSKSPLALRVAAAADTRSSPFGAIITPAPIDPPDDASRALAESLVNRGREFLADAWFHVEALRDLRTSPRTESRDARYAEILAVLHDKLALNLDELFASRPMDEERAALLSSVLTVSSREPYDGQRARDRQRMRAAAIKVARLTHGEALVDAGTLIAQHTGRAGYGSSDYGIGTGRLRASPTNTEALFHELGHAWDYARRDLVRASVALVDSLAVAPGTFSLNNLYVVEQLARHLPGARHEGLLRHFCSVATPETRLDSKEALRLMFAGLGADEGIDSLCSDPRAFDELRVYGSDELARPIVGVSYAGAVYANGLSTEIVSMGLGALASPQQLAWELVYGPPERIAFVLGAILETC